METRNERRVPFYATHPGRILKEELAERGIKQKDLAEAMGVQVSHLSEVITGKRSMTSALAAKLEEALGIDAAMWMRLQHQYEHDSIVIQQRSIEEQKAANEISEFENACSTKILLDRLGIEGGFLHEQLAKLKSIIGCDNAATLQLQMSGAFRKSEKLNGDPKMIMTWVLLAKAAREGQMLGTAYSHDNDEAMIQELVGILHENQDTLNRVRHTLNKYGVQFRIVEKVEKAPIDGYSFLEDGVPTIVLTKRYDRIDNFAFTLMHEVGHVVEETTDDLAHLATNEDNANDFAAGKLIKKSLWDKAPMERMNVFRIQRAYTKWAEENDLNPWIVLGRVSYELDTWKFKSNDDRKIK